MNFLALTGLLNAVVCGMLAFLVLAQRPGNQLAWAYGFFNFAVALWSSAYVFWQCAATAPAALPLLRWTIFFSFWPNVAFLWLAHSYSRPNQSARRILFFDGLVKLPLIGANAAGWTVASVTSRIQTGFWGDPTIWLTLTIIWWQTECLYGFWILSRPLFRLATRDRSRMYYMLAALAAGHLGAFVNWLPWYGWHCPAELNGLVSLCSLLLAYAIFRYQVLDIRIVLKRTLLYSLLSAVLVSVYAVIVHILAGIVDQFNFKGFIPSAGGAAAMALLFHPLHARIQRWVDQRFPRESLNPAMLREATGTFVHEIKRPLANISVPAELALLEIERLDGSESSARDLLPKLSTRLRYILEQSMEAGAKMEVLRRLSSRAPLIEAPVDLKSLLDGLLAREQLRLKRSKIDITFQALSQTPQIEGDAEELSIAIGNIIKNAVDALSKTEGEPRELRLLLHGQAGHAVLNISNSGPGISKSDIERLFDPWFTTKGEGAMGIGLYLTNEILKRHKALVNVTSHQAEGTRFRITFRKALE